MWRAFEIRGGGTMRREFEGGCQCASVRYRVTGTPITLFICHCSECQKQTASAFGMALWIKEPVVEITGETPREWTRLTPSGRQMLCAFCPVCGCRLFHRYAGANDLMSIKPGTLDDTSWLRPVGHIFTSRRQPWLKADVGICYDAGPPGMDELLRAWREADLG